MADRDRRPIAQRLAEFHREAKHLHKVVDNDEPARAGIRVPLENTAVLAIQNSGFAARDETGALMCFAYLRADCEQQARAFLPPDTYTIVPVSLQRT